MGAKQSVQPDPIPDPNIFINIGCVGLDNAGIIGNRLNSAPFLTIQFQAGIFTTVKNKKVIDNVATYNAIHYNIQTYLSQIKPGWIPPVPILSGSNSSNLFNFGSIYGQIDAANPLSGKSKSGHPNDYDAQVEMTQRLKEISDLLNTSYSNYNDNNIDPNIVPNNIWSLQGGSLNGRTMAYWNTKYVYGPIYLLAAQDKQTKILDCYLYFPTMTKDSRLWPNLNCLGLSHNWMRMLLYGTSSRIQWCRNNDVFPYLTKDVYEKGYTGPKNPCINGYTNCKQTFNKMRGTKNKGPFGVYKSTTFYPSEQAIEDRFMFGCKTSSESNPYECQQSKQAHIGMGLYDKNKSKNEYPLAYYHAYALRSSDPRINSYINDGPYSLQYLTNSLYDGKSCGLAQNILPAHTVLMQGCTTALISQNNLYYFVLGANNLTLYKNAAGRNLSLNCANNAFSGLQIISNIALKNSGYNTSLMIEDNFINIYSASTKSGSVDVVKEIPFMNANSVTLASQFTLVLQNDGNIQIIDIDNNVAGSLNGDAQKVPYNNTEDYNRRLLNLKLYLIFRHIYIDAQSSNNTTTTNELSPTNANQINIPAYNSETNYMQRMFELLAYLSSKNKISPETLKYYRQYILSRTGADTNGLIYDDSSLFSGFDFGLPPLPQKDLQTTTLPGPQTYGLVYDSADKLGTDKLGVDKNKSIDATAAAESVEKAYNASVIADQAETNSKAINESNPENGIDPNPCVGYLGAPSCSVKLLSSGNSPGNSPSEFGMSVFDTLSLLQDPGADANNIFGLSPGSIMNNFQLPYGSSAPVSKTKYQINMEERLESLKTYIDIQKLTKMK